MSNATHTIFVGGYSEPIKFGTGEIVPGKGKGIYRFDIDVDNGQILKRALTGEIRNPSYICLNRSRTLLFAVNELKEFRGEVGGAVAAFRVEWDGALILLNSQPTRGADPCHLTLDPDERFLLVANYSGGSMAVFPVLQEGFLGPASAFIQHSGSSEHPVRQAGPHPHAAIFDPSGRRVYVPDLGLDQIMIYDFDSENGGLTPAKVPTVRTAPGAGPRQLAMRPKGGYAYLVNELNSTLTAYRHDVSSGALDEFQTLSTLPIDPAPGSTASEIQIAPNGKGLYVSNRGHNSLALFTIHPSTGLLTPDEHQSTSGSTPRHFMISPDGRYVIVANQDSDNLIVFSIGDGNRLASTGLVLDAPTPSCVQFL